MSNLICPLWPGQVTNNRGSALREALTRLQFSSGWAKQFDKRSEFPQPFPLSPFARVPPEGKRRQRAAALGGT
jgi:hypothetical protein